MNRPALTLLEVLLALALLTAAAAAGASLMQTSRSAAGGSAERFDAASVLRRWQAEAAAPEASEAEQATARESWTWTDPKGRTWSLVESSIPAAAPDPDPDDSATMPTIAWVSIELYFTPSAGAAAELVLRTQVPAHTEHDARGAP